MSSLYRLLLDNELEEAVLAVQNVTDLFVVSATAASEHRDNFFQRRSKLESVLKASDFLQLGEQCCLVGFVVAKVLLVHKRKFDFGHCSCCCGCYSIALNE